ncbi:MAG: ATP-binding protein [Chloroflexota bacterium]
MTRSLDILRKFTDVPSTDPDDRRRARLLNISLLGFQFVGVAAILLIGFIALLQISNWQNMLPTLWSALAVLLLFTFIMWLNRRGRVLLASTLFLLILTLGIVFANLQALQSGGTLFYFVIPVVMASVLLRPYASFIAAGFISLLLVIIAISQQYTPAFLIGTVGMFAIAFVSWLSARSLENALQELRVINQELDQRVAQRTHELAQANQALETQARQLARTNITLEKQTFELAEANQRLQSLDQLKSKFVSDVSHELRTPISNLKIYVEMLRFGKREKLEQFLGVLQEEIERLAQLIEDILDLSRMELGTTKTEFAWVALNRVVEQVVLANQLRAEAKGLEIAFEPAQGLPSVWVDAKQINQVTNNLVGNAVNYTLQGRVLVSTHFDPQEQHIRLQVKDTGIGIDPLDIPHVFERFYRGMQASQSSIRGTGLGLSITKEIVERHKGRIEVQSQVGSGTTFIVYLPTGTGSPDQPANPEG